MGAITTDGYIIIIYRRYNVNTAAVDSAGKTRALSVLYIAIDIKRYNAILGFLWTYKVDPNC